MRARVGVRSDVGRVRDGNEDSVVVEESLYAVADGMGGHLGGEVASQTAAGIIHDHAEAEASFDRERLVAILREANNAIRKRARTDTALEGMGTTCTLLFLDGRKVLIAHVGDSRAYLFRNGELELLTEDHTLVERMVREGRLSPEEAERHPQRNIITRGLGVDDNVEIDTKVIELQDRDRLLLCSDGLTSMLDRRSIGEALKDETDPQEAADRLVALANEAGGEDNITVVVLDIEDKEGTSAPPAPPTSAVARPEVSTGELEPVDEELRVPRKSRGRRAGKGILAVLLLGAVVAAGFVGTRYLLDNSFFVGIGDGERVTIYRGIPEEIGSLSLKQIEETTDLSWSELPTENLKNNVKDGIKTATLAEARQTVSNLRARVQDFADQTRSKDNQDNPQQDAGSGG
ncbi:MAG: Stp1/IreP family PP2C-type Ser/Thr phosphatase [Actinobacteria bacterium]|nr:Stp1/IreP family PP2C-type Ser/Thr phosphatase [Actinomycetota bacterium]